jgi:hypothetical protein
VLRRTALTRDQKAKPDAAQPTSLPPRAFASARSAVSSQRSAASERRCWRRAETERGRERGKFQVHKFQVSGSRFTDSRFAGCRGARLPNLKPANLPTCQRPPATLSQISPRPLRLCGEIRTSMRSGSRASTRRRSPSRQTAGTDSSFPQGVTSRRGEGRTGAAPCRSRSGLRDRITAAIEAEARIKGSAREPARRGRPLELGTPRFRNHWPV